LENSASAGGGKLLLLLRSGAGGAPPLACCCAPAALLQLKCRLIRSSLLRVRGLRAQPPVAACVPSAPCADPPGLVRVLGRIRHLPALLLRSLCQDLRGGGGGGGGGPRQCRRSVAAGRLAARAPQQLAAPRSG
jgi:hypothetical protein